MAMDKVMSPASKIIPKISANTARLFTFSRICLAVLLIFAFSLRLLIAFTFPNILWPDEIFQSLEQAHRLAFGHGVIPWEYRYGIRSWLFPGILGGIFTVTGGIATGANGYLTGVTIFLGILSLIPVWVGFSIAYRTAGLPAAILTGGFCALWFELIFFAPKALTEVVSAYTLLLAVYLGCYGPLHPSRSRLYWTGFLYGLTTILRLHLFPAVLIAIAYQCRKRNWKQLFPLGAGFIGPVLLGGFLDALTWSYPFQSLWKNIWINAIEGKSTYWGVSEWHQYFYWLLVNWSWFIFPLGILCLLGTRRHLILAILPLVILVSHSFIAHKEYRFIFAALPMIVILIGLGTADLLSRLSFLRRFPRGTSLAVITSLILWAIASGILAGRFDTNQSFDFTKPFQKTKETHWTIHAGSLKSFQYLSTKEDLCGVGVQGINWWWTGGYAYLHQDVPLYLVKDKKVFAEQQPYFNYLVFNQDTPVVGEYQRVQCFDGVCVYQRSNPCQSNPNYHINTYLQETGQ
jgi:GPI mannosyltransferase 3